MTAHAGLSFKKSPQAEAVGDVEEGRGLQANSPGFVTGGPVSLSSSLPFSPINLTFRVRMPATPLLCVQYMLTAHGVHADTHLYACACPHDCTCLRNRWLAHILFDNMALPDHSKNAFRYTQPAFCIGAVTEDHAITDDHDLCVLCVADAHPPVLTFALTTDCFVAMFGHAMYITVTTIVAHLPESEQLNGTTVFISC